MASNLTRGSTIHNDENVFPDEMKRRALRPRPVQGIPKRSALSVINDNVPVPKAVKGQVAIKKPNTASTFAGSKSLIPPPKVVKPTGNTFSIFQDNSLVAAASELPTNIVKLYKPEPIATKSLPLSTTSSDLETEDESSPMVLDTSVDQRSTNDFTEKEELFFNSIYREDIYAYVKELEKKYRPNPTYIKKQPDITEAMRSILVDWLVEVVEEYKMQIDTLYLAVSYIDRFLSHMSVQKSKLQLVGTACMFIASKYEEIYPPDIKDFVYITDDTYTKRQVLRMEHLILKVLSFDLTDPTAYYFLRHLCCVIKASEKVRFLAQYLCELTLLESEPFLPFLPSEIAAAALCLANYTLDEEPWSKELQDISGYTIKDFAACLECLFKRYRSIAIFPQQSITEKYKSSRFLYVAVISPPHQLILNE